MKIKKNLKFSVECTLAALLLMALLQPFGIDQLKEEERFFFLLGQTVCMFICSFLCQLSIDKVLSTSSINEGSSWWRIFLRSVPYFVLISLILAGVLLSFNSWFNTGSPTTYWFNEEGFSMYGYWYMLRQVFIISLFVWVWVLYSDRSRSLEDELAEMKALNKLLEERQEQQSEVEIPTVEEEPQKCVLESATNHLTLEVDPRDIIYVESMSNYADICYMEEGETRHKTLRITMKQLRESLANADCLVSCHRAFIVNVNFIVSITTRPTGGYQLQIFGQDTMIPVSRTYTDEIKRRIQ